MQLSKAFDPTALVAALKAKGLVDAEAMVNADVLPTFFDWLNSSVSMDVPAPYGTIATRILSDLESKALAEIAALEAKI